MRGYPVKKYGVGYVPRGGVDKSIPEASGEVVEEVSQALPEPEKAEVIEEVKTLQQEFPMLTSSGFQIPFGLSEFRNKKTKQIKKRWGIKHMNAAAEVFEGVDYIRTYSRKVHGDNYLKLAESIVEKKNRLLE